MSGVAGRGRLRVAFVSQGLGRIEPPNAHGSIATWTYETARRMTCDHDVILLEFGERALTTVQQQHEDMTCVYLPVALNRVINALHRRASALWQRLTPAAHRLRRPPYTSIFHNLGFIILASIEARRRGCDVIHIHNFSQFVLVMRWFNPSARIVLHMHCEWLSQHEQAMIRHRLERTDAILCCSGHVAGRVLARFPRFGSKLRVVFNGADVGRFVRAARTDTQSSPEQLRILFVGRISPEKGVHILVDAFVRIAGHFPSARLDLVGGAGSLPPEFLVALSDDPHVRDLMEFYRSDYLEEVKSRIPARLHERVMFHGNRSRNQVLAHLQESTIFVNPSLSDAFPLTVVEAMAAGVPIVATAVGGVPEAVIDEQSGLLVPPNSSEALADGLSRLLRDVHLRRRLADAARRQSLEKFSWEAVARQCEESYGELFDKNPCPDGMRRHPARVILEPGPRAGD